MSRVISKVNIQSQLLASSNPHEQVRLKKISNKLMKKLLEHNTDYSTTITNNGSKLNISTIKHEATTLPKVASQRIIQNANPIKQSKIK
jgi:hypothetical protein